MEGVGPDDEEHGDYFVSLDRTAGEVPSGGPSEPSWTVGSSSTRRLGIVVVLALAMAVALAATAALVRSAVPAGPPSEARPAPVAVEQDGFRFWTLNADGSPVRWNPCEPIRWVLNPHGAPVGAERDIEAAMASVASVSGLEFEFVGVTDEAPGQGRSPYQPDRYGPDVWAPVLVAWSAPGADVALGERDRAVAIPVAVGDATGSVFVSGQIVFNRERHLQPGFGDRGSSLGATAMHEVGHLVGLDHVADPDQLMFPHPHLGSVRWGDGDRRGLEALGVGGGCLEAVPPHDVSVTFEPDITD